MQIKNKRADIPVTILVLIVVVICILAIFSFIYSRTSSQNYFFGPGLIETVNSFSEEISFYEKTGFSQNYGNSFESGNVRISVNANVIEGNYSRSGFPLLSSDKEKVLINVIYQR